MEAPCKDCTKRHVGCHSECNEYCKFVEERRKIYKIRLMQHGVNEYFSRKAISLADEKKFGKSSLR